MEKSKTFRNLFAIIKWECYNKQTCRVEIDSAVILVLMRFQRFPTLTALIHKPNNKIPTLNGLLQKLRKEF